MVIARVKTIQASGASPKITPPPFGVRFDLLGLEIAHIFLVNIVAGAAEMEGKAAHNKRYSMIFIFSQHPVS